VKLFLSSWSDLPKAGPSETLLFAVGDVHGRMDLLEPLQEVLRQLAERSCASAARTVYLGDYVDRGPNSLQVLANLAQCARGPAPPVFLLGNHDYYLRHAVQEAPKDPTLHALWFEYGGLQTLESLGLHAAAAADLDLLAEQLRLALGPDLIAFLNSLLSHHREADLLFVHAGIRPGVALDQQESNDLLFIREPFLSWSGASLPCCVIHGHTPEQPGVRPHRISVDSGAYRTDALSAVQIEASRYRYVTLTLEEDLAALQSLPRPGVSLEFAETALPMPPAREI
jgi:serine/threonine protein phosphatase 1